MIYWFHSPGVPAVLLWVFAKNATADLTKDQYRRLIDAVEGLAKDSGGPK